MKKLLLVLIYLLFSSVLARNLVVVDETDEFVVYCDTDSVKKLENGNIRFSKEMNFKNGTYYIVELEINKKDEIKIIRYIVLNDEKKAVSIYENHELKKRNVDFSDWQKNYAWDYNTFLELLEDEKR